VAMLRLVRELACARGLAVAAVLHDLNLAAAMATRIAVLADGRIVCDAAPETVISADLVRDVFGSGLVVGRHDGRPMVLPVP
jgi:iron complex transport system ATP-binding protein